VARLWLPLTLFSSVARLQPAKGAIVGLQWQTGMHGFERSKPRRLAEEAALGLGRNRENPLAMLSPPLVQWRTSLWCERERQGTSEHRAGTNKIVKAGLLDRDCAANTCHHIEWDYRRWNRCASSLMP
jgi:hypothetical protein